MFEKVRISIVLAAWLSCSPLSAEHADGKRLIEMPEISAQDLSTDELEAFERLRGGIGVGSARLINVDDSALTANKVIITLPQDEAKSDVTLQIESKQYRNDDDNSFAWTGLLEGQQIRLVVRNGNVSGAFYFKGYQYALQPLTEKTQRSVHVLLRQDVGKRLFTMQDEGSLTPKQKIILARLRDQHTASDLIVLRSNIDVLNARKLALPLPLSKQSEPVATIEAISRSGNAGEQFELRGQINGHRIRLRARNDSIYLSFPFGKFDYDIRPLGDGVHALIQHDRGRIQEHPDDAPVGN